MENDPDLLSKIIFSDEATFPLSGKVNRHKVKIWGTQNPHTTLEFERNSPKMNEICAVTERAVYGPFFHHWLYCGLDVCRVTRVAHIECL
ncbi:hypothetical protein PoB_000264800 [Plakobranchus ocellatus]|uniref:Tc1-like transposase DDE domain-containing protein n=1 Tax=Plakobranchus ocellatus TaxID=259542 RepID=A0AAV3Y0H0_9GAST|nr:hypothetical protein PoB_000264800 [Plakobranchus ocellatus]